MDLKELKVKLDQMVQTGLKELQEDQADQVLKAKKEK